MKNSKLTVKFNISLDAQDISQLRIRQTGEFLKNYFEYTKNKYIMMAKLEDESDLEDFVLNLYAHGEIIEDIVSDENSANNFVMDMVKSLDEIAQVNAYADMEGSFFIEFNGKKEEFKFTSYENEYFCNYEEVK